MQIRIRELFGNYMNIDDKLQQLREQYKTASTSMREIIKRQARALMLAKSKQEKKNNQESFF